MDSSELPVLLVESPSFEACHLLLMGSTVQDNMIVENLMESVDAIISNLGKLWIFIFDQIDKLFLKPKNLHAADAPGRDFPFHCIKLVMKPHQITSIISASANNEMACKERLKAFWSIFICVK